MESKNSNKRFYLKWPWNVVVYIVLVAVLRIFSVPVILLIMWWNKKQQPNGPEEGYCLQRTRKRLIGLIPSAACIGGGVLALWFFFMGQTLPGEVERLDSEMRIFYYLCPFLGVGAILIGLFLAYRSLRDAMYPEKSALAQSIRDQLTYPDEAPSVNELFAMVDQDLRENGQWYGNLGIGKEWILGDAVSRISRIRGIFRREEQHTIRSGNRTRVTYIYEVRILDDRQQLQITSLRSQKQLNDAMECLRQRVPAALFGIYDSKEYNSLVYSEDEMEKYAQEQAYQQRKSQLEERQRQERAQQAQNQVLTMPDGSVTSRISWDCILELLHATDQTDNPGPFQLVPGVPFKGQKHTFSRLVCMPGGGMRGLTRILMEEYSGTPGEPGRYAWTQDVPVSETESVLRGWLRGEIPALDNWTRIERAGQTWADATAHPPRSLPSVPPQPSPGRSWSLSVGGGSSLSDPSWKSVEENLWMLNEEVDSFLILEQNDPDNPETCWFIQCAVARMGPDQGKYSVEIGVVVPGGSCLWEKMVSDVQTATAYFSDAYYHRQIDVSGFRKMEL